MHLAHTIRLATAAIILFTASGADACFRHTFDKCDGAFQVAEAKPIQSSQVINSSSSPNGWVTTVKVNR